MTQQSLSFESKTYQLLDGTTRTYEMYDDRRIELILKELQAIYQREDKRPEGCNQLPTGGLDDLFEAIGLLERAIEWPGETEDITGEPPITLDEMHTAAWHQHQAMHS